MAGAVRTPVTRSPKTKGAKQPVYSTWKQILFHGRSFTIGSNYFHKPNTRYSLDYHTGQDISMARGTPVHTPMGGRVVAPDRAGAYGNNVKIQLDNGDYIFFAHLNSVSVSPGTRVKAGTNIGTVGSTGTSTGPHLHLEIRTAASGGRFGEGNFKDPIAYLSGKKATNVDYSAKPTLDKGGSGGGTTTTTTGGGGGGGGGGKVAGFTKAEYYKWLDAKFGSIKILREMDAAARKELGGQSIDWLVDKLAKEKITDESIAATYMNQTGWFKKYGEDASRRLVSEKQRPKFFAESVANHKAGVQAQLGTLGFNLTDKALSQLARDSYIYGWDVNRAIDEAQRRFADTGEVTYDGGELGVAQDKMEEAAWELGVQLSAQDIRSMRTDVIDGKGYQSQLDDLRERSAKLYSVYSEQIRSGQSLRAVASEYFQRAAELLELGSPDQVSMDDPLFTGGKAFMAADPATGKMIPKGMWDFEKEVRQDRRWLETANARDTTYKAATDVLNLMGLV